MEQVCTILLTDTNLAFSVGNGTVPINANIMWKDYFIGGNQILAL